MKNFLEDPRIFKQNGEQLKPTKIIHVLIILLNSNH